MSAAATAAGYLYASGRLRGKGAREGGEGEHHREPAPEKPKRRELRVAVYAPETPKQEPGVKKSPKIEYRTRRWRPE
jgi:hypothetical protein